MSLTFNQQDIGELINGFEKLRTGAMVYLISVILLFISTVLFMAMGMSLLGISEYTPDKIAEVLGGLMAGFIPMVLAVILSLIAFILWFIATGHFKRHDPTKLGIGRLGMILQLVAVVIILVILGVVLATITTGSSEAVLGGLLTFTVSLIPAAIISIVGTIFFAMMLMRLPEEPKVDPGFKTAGTFYIVALILSFIPYVNIVGSIIGLVAVIMVYLASGTSIKTLQQPPFQPTQPPKTEISKTQCPSCGYIFSYQKNPSGPTKVKCPSCGKEGIIR